MFRLGRQRGRSQADHSVVRRHYFCLGARYIQELFLSADTSEAVCRYDQCKYPCYQRCHRAKTSPSSAHHNLLSSVPTDETEHRSPRGFRLAQRNYFDIRNCFAALLRAFIRAKGGCISDAGDSWLKLGGRTIRFMRHAATK